MDEETAYFWSGPLKPSLPKHPRSSYEIAAVASIYRFWTPMGERWRIAQFFVLPHAQVSSETSMKYASPLGHSLLGRLWILFGELLQAQDYICSV